MTVRPSSTPGSGNGTPPKTADLDVQSDRRVRQFMLDTGETDYLRAFALVYGDADGKSFGTT